MVVVVVGWGGDACRECEQRATSDEWKLDVGPPRESSLPPRSRDLPDERDARIKVAGSLPSRLELGCRRCPTKKSLVWGQRGFHHMGWRRAFVPVNSQTDVSFLARTNDDSHDNHECPRIENC